MLAITDVDVSFLENEITRRGLIEEWRQVRPDSQ
jgi:hypothetical protein